MYIENRRKKKYSQKLFNELVITCLIFRSSYFYKNEALEILNVSERSFRRYINELEETGIFSSYGCEGLNSHKDANGDVLLTPMITNYLKAEKYYGAGKIPQKKTLNFLSPAIYKQKGLKSENEHISRLTRLIILMWQVVYKSRTRKAFDEGVYYYETDGWYFNVEDYDEVRNYYFQYLDHSLSQKKFKRDLDISIDVIAFVNNLY